MKVYICGPISGRKNKNAEAFTVASDIINTIGHLPLSPFDVESKVAHDWQWYMRRTIKMMLDADEVVVLPGWETSKGARLEHTIATQLEIPVYTLGEWTEIHVQPAAKEEADGPGQG